MIVGGVEFLGEVTQPGESRLSETVFYVMAIRQDVLRQVADKAMCLLQVFVHTLARLFKKPKWCNGTTVLSASMLWQNIGCLELKTTQLVCSPVV